MVEGVKHSEVVIGGDACHGGRNEDCEAISRKYAIPGQNQEERGEAHARNTQRKHVENDVELIISQQLGQIIHVEPFH